MITPKDELTALLTLVRIEGLGPAKAKTLYTQVGNALEIFRSYKDLNDIIPGVTQCLIKTLNDSGSLFMAERELSFIKEHHIRILTFEDADYPARLRECEDAPLVLFSLGKIDPNTKHTIAVVGTRKATVYGKELATKLVKDIAVHIPDTLIISGLAYGIDITAHKAAMDSNIQTIGILAHGLDRIYPSAHRQTALQMLENGGVLTEYMSGQMPLKYNFVRRNRIIAGMADAVIVVESSLKGGSLITAEIAESYSRACFAFPGSVGDVSSAGCNELIRSNRAGLIQSADDLIKDMGWETVCSKNPVQRELFYNLTETEQKILKIISRTPKGAQLNTLVVECNIPAGQMMSLLFELEMKEMIKSHPGCLYTTK